MKKLTHYVPVRLDSETLALLKELMQQTGKGKRSAVIRACIQEQAKRVLGK